MNFIILFLVALYPYIVFYQIWIGEIIGLASTHVLWIYFGLFIIIELFYGKKLIGFWVTKLSGLLLIIVFFSINIINTEEYARAINMVFNLFAGGIVAKLIYERKIIQKFINVFSISISIFAILIYLKIPQMNFSYYDLSNMRFGFIQGEEIYLDPNWLAYWIGISTLFYLTYGRGFFEGKYKIILYFFLSTNFIFLILTKSRSILLGFLFALLLYILIRKYYFIFIMGFLSIVSIIIWYQISDIKVFKRLFEMNLLESDRFVLMEASFKAITMTPITTFFGNGVGDGDMAVGRFYELAVLGSDGILRYNNHNFFLDWIIQTGIVGAVVLILLILLSIVNAVRMARTEYYYFSILLIFSMICAAAYNPLKNPIWIIIFAILCSLYLEYKNNKIFGKVEEL